MDTNTRKPGLHPLITAAAVSVTVFSAVGVGALTGVLPHSVGKEAASSAQLSPEPGQSAVEARSSRLATNAEVATMPPATAASTPAPKPVHKPVKKHVVAHASTAAPMPDFAGTPPPPPPGAEAQAQAPVA